MANLAIVGTHSTNGVAAIHSELLRTKTVPDFAELFPERFNNKTNGVTPRRWLLLANPDLAEAAHRARSATGWVTDLARLARLDPLADDAGFRDKFRRPSGRAKVRFVDWIKTTAGIAPRPGHRSSTCQVKRIHEYKRQLLNALHVVVCTTGCGRTRTWTCRRGRSCSPARRPRRTTWPSSSSSSSTTSAGS